MDCTDSTVHTVYCALWRVEKPDECDERQDVEEDKV